MAAGDIPMSDSVEVLGPTPLYVDTGNRPKAESS